jgi:hypothetical protein
MHHIPNKTLYPGLSQVIPGKKRIEVIVRLKKNSALRKPIHAHETSGRTL